MPRHRMLAVNFFLFFVVLSFSSVAVVLGVGVGVVRVGSDEGRFVSVENVRRLLITRQPATGPESDEKSKII